LLLCAVASVLYSGATHAQGGALTFTFENDTFTGTDNNYTNGLGLTWTTGELTSDGAGFASKWLRFWSFAPFVGDDDYRMYASWSLNHEVHTATDISLADPPEYDQPYSGVLYIDSLLHARNDRWGHTWTLRAGIVGPSSHAEQIQQELHELIGSRLPQGWDTQLPDEPVLNLDYTAMYLWREGDVGDLASWRLVPMGGLSFGNYFAGVNLGVYGEIGWNLPDALGGSTMRHGFTAAGTLGTKPLDRWSLSLFAGIGGYGVGHYLPLDGTVFKESRSVDSNSLAGVLTTGLTFRRKGLVVSFAQSFFSKTFEGERDREAFGTFGVAWYRRTR
jgi:lipid A 3-O-deacylase